MNAEKPSLSIALKTLWGAAQMPFGEACAEPYRHPSFEELSRRLEQLCDIGASGLLHGANGVGKSYLCGCFTEKLPEKRYKILSLAHSSLTGSDLIRALCRQLGVEAQMRRSDNVETVEVGWPDQEQWQEVFRSSLIGSQSESYKIVSSAPELTHRPLKK